MNSNSSRRDLLLTGTQTLLTAALCAGSPHGSGATERSADGEGPGILWPGFPRQDQKLVSEIVGASHFNEQRVKELLEAYPELVNASWDWGFGDWETALGAASHTGQRGIAELLLSRGARIDIFASAMLGYTSTVKALIEAQPGIQRTLGPHGITLLAHAKAGGNQAEDTVEYLLSLGDADLGLKTIQVAVEDRPRYLGSFASEEMGLKLECRLNRAGLLVIDVQAGETQSGNRIIHCLGGDEFFPAGVSSVRICFARKQDVLTAVTVRGSVPEITLQRVRN